MNRRGGRSAFVLVGATASGKSDLAQEMAEASGAVIVSADAMLVYRGMDIGTAKPDASQRQRVRYLGINLADPASDFNVWQYRQTVLDQIRTLPDSCRILVTGGSGLYIKALTEGLFAAGGAPEERERWETLLAKEGIAGLRATLARRDPAALEALADPDNPRRLIRALERGVPIRTSCPASASPVMAGLQWDPPALNRRIEQRVRNMYANGLLDEVGGLAGNGGGLSRTARQAIGYAEALDVLAGRCSLETAMARTVARTRRLAKRQRTWFRHQAQVEWVDVRPEDSTGALAERVEQIWSKHGPIPLA